MARTILLMAVVAALFGAGLWLLGVPMEWASWKTPVGISLISVAAVLAGSNLHRRAVA